MAKAITMVSNWQLSLYRISSSARIHQIHRQRSNIT